VPEPLVVAAAQPETAAGDLRGNALRHAQVVRDAGARLVVFPELSLTGYALDAPVVAPDDPLLAPIVEACAQTRSIALVGAPVADSAGQRFIAMLALGDGPTRIAYRKTWLGGGEVTAFAPGDGPTVLRVDGWRLGLGICKDTGSAQHTAGTAALDVDAYVAGLVHRPEELPEQAARAVVIARACRAFVVFASFAGATGDVFDLTAGGSAIYSPSGIAISRADASPGSVARATLA
jgi:predicted amidohydrolase